MKYLNYRFILIILLICFSSSCDYYKDIDTSLLEGYWEIESVTLIDGLKKEYTFSETIDFLSFTDSLSGIRKKMKPNFNGYFETSNDAERFEIKIENDSVNVYYKTPFDKWKETILKLTENQLIVINKNKAIFTYKRYEPITIN
jgi:hypothetical protein